MAADAPAPLTGGEGEGHDPQGFDAWDVLIDPVAYVDPRFRSANGVGVEPGSVTDLITEMARGWLDAQDGDEPRCLLIHHEASCTTSSTTPRPPLREDMTVRLRRAQAAGDDAPAAAGGALR